jgi:hypothetical protein
MIRCYEIDRSDYTEPDVRRFIVECDSALAIHEAMQAIPVHPGSAIGEYWGIEAHSMPDSRSWIVLCCMNTNWFAETIRVWVESKPIKSGLLDYPRGSTS